MNRTKYICQNCKHVMDEEDIAVWKEERGDFDYPVYETMSGCPKCRGGIEEASECESCGNFFPHWYVEDGVCEDCQSKMEGGDEE